VSKSLAALILFVVVGGVLVFISADKAGSTVAQIFLGTAILLLLLQDANSIQAGSEKLLGVLGASQIKGTATPTNRR
jgi:hypothetical protein